MLLIPSTADEIEIAGVMNPSAISVEHPISAGIMIHLYRRSFKRAKRAGDLVYIDLKHGRKASEYISGRIIYPEHLVIIFINNAIFMPDF